jgi:hypothetical protein
MRDGNALVLGNRVVDIIWPQYSDQSLLDAETRDMIAYYEKVENQPRQCRVKNWLYKEIRLG